MKGNPIDACCRALAAKVAPRVTAPTLARDRTDQAAPCARTRWASLAVDLRPAAIAFAVHLALVLLVASVATAWLPHRHGAPVAQPMQGVAHYVVEPLAGWDGVWYAGIAEHGYGARRENAAFWPLYPLLLRAGHALTGRSVATVGVVLSNLLFIAALVLLHRMVRRERGTAVAGRVVWLLALCPLAFYFSAVYTESLFLLATVGAVFLARAGRWWWAAAAGVVAALTRNSGVLLLVPLGLLLVERVGWDPRRWWRQAVPLAGIALAPLLFFWRLDRVWGDPLLTLHVQSFWKRYPAMPWHTLADAFGQLGQRYAGFTAGCLAYPSPAHLGACAAEVSSHPSPYNGPIALTSLLLLVPLAGFCLWRLRPADSLYALTALVLPLFSPSRENPVMSYGRFALVLFPLFVGLALLLGGGWRYRFTLALSVALGAWILALFCMGLFVG